MNSDFTTQAVRLRIDERNHVEKPLLDQLAGLDWEIIDLDSKQHPGDTFRETFTEVVMLPVLRAQLRPESVIRNFRITADDGKTIKNCRNRGRRKRRNHGPGQNTPTPPKNTGRHRGLPLQRDIDMTYGADIHRRRSIRLQGYDYSRAGVYFVTICAQNREYLFGDIADGKTVLNDAGTMIQTVWDEIPFHYIGTEIDEFVVMPNHIHGIIDIVRATPRGCPVSSTPRGSPGAGASGSECGYARENGQAQGPAPTGNAGTLSLGDIVHRFKTMTTKRYADGVKQSGWQSFSGRLWQRNYWEHVVRNEIELNRIREYIHNNPAQWESDRLNLHKGRSAYPPMVREPVVAYTIEGWMV